MSECRTLAHAVRNFQCESLGGGKARDSLLIVNVMLNPNP